MQRWIPGSIIYQINLRSLAAREPRNAIEAASERPLDLSPLAYVTKHLPRLRKLGMTVLHFMPPYPIGVVGRKGIGSPYAARDYQAVDPEYGTIDEFRDLVRKAHALGFRVIVGMVPNHSSPDHVWTSPHPEYYVHRPDGQIAYDLDWSDTAKLDYTNPGLRAAMTEVYDFWLGLLGGGDGVDGFRIDMAHFINDRSFWDEAIPELRRRHADREILFLAECYGLDNSLDLFRRGFDAAYDDLLYKVWTFFYGINGGGASDIVPDPRLPEYAEFRSMREQFMAHGLAGVLEHVLAEYERVLPGIGHAVYLARYSDNHDEGRGAYRFGPGAVRAIQRLIYLSHRALPFMLTGQEFGATNRPSIHERIGPCDKGRRIRRGDGIVTQEGVEFEGNLFARGYQARQECYAFHRELARVRRRTPALVDGAFRILACGEDAPEQERTVVAFERRHGRTTIRCAVNMGPRARRLNRPELFDGALLYGNWEKGVLRPFSAIAVRCGKGAAGD